MRLSSPHHPRSRTRRHTGFVVLLAALLVVAGVTPAHASGGYTPPALPGTVRFGLPATQTSCAADGARTTTFSVALNASKLRAETSFTIGAIAVSTSSGSGTYQPLGLTVVTVAAKSRPTLTATFTVPSSVPSAWSSDFVVVPGSRTDTDAWRYVRQIVPIACSPKPLSARPGPRVTGISPVHCDGTADIAIDSSQDATPYALRVGSGRPMYLNGGDLTAGQVQTISVDRVVSGQVLTIEFSGTQARGPVVLNAGSYRLTADAC